MENIELEEGNISLIHERYGTKDKSVILDSEDEDLKNKVELFGARAIGKLQLILRTIDDANDIDPTEVQKYNEIEEKMRGTVHLDPDDKIIATMDKNPLNSEIQLIYRMIGEENIDSFKNLVMYHFNEYLDGILGWSLPDIIRVNEDSESEEVSYSESEQDSSSSGMDEDTQGAEKVDGSKKRKREESDEDSRGMPEKKRRLENENEQENIEKMDVVDQIIFHPVNAEEYQQNMELIRENVGKTVWQSMVSGFPYEGYLLSNQQVKALRNNRLIPTVPDGDCSINAVLQSLGEERMLNEVRAQLATNAYNDGVVDEEAAQEILQPGSWVHSDVMLPRLAQLLNVQITIIDDNGQATVVGADDADNEITIYHVQGDIGHYYGSK